MGLRLGRWEALALVVSFAAFATACGGTDEGPLSRHGGSTSDTPTGDGAGGEGTAAAPPARAACPDGLPAATMIAADDRVEDLRILGDAIYFRVGGAVSRMDKKGGARAQVYANDDLARSWVDESGMLFVTSPNPPDAVLVRTTLDGAPQFTVPTNWEAFQTRVFASDDQWLYVSTQTEAGDAIFEVSKTTGQLVQLASFGVAPEDAITDAQLAGGNVWFVRGDKRVYEIELSAADPAGDPKGLPGGEAPEPAREIFGSGYETCRLAVGNSAYCSDGKALVRRDLTGANAQTIFDASKSAAESSLGAPFVAGDALFLRPDAASNAGTIRAVKPSGATAEEKIVACGRGAIEDLAVDATSVVWSETGATKGVWIVPR